MSVAGDGPGPVTSVGAGSAAWFAGVHVDRAAGGDFDHLARQCGDIAGGLAGAVAPAGERGGPAASGGVGRARDAALHSGTPSGIRLLPDPAFPLIYQANGLLDPTQPLAANRIIPIESAPEYSEGRLMVPADNVFNGINIPYPAINGGGFYPIANNATIGNVLAVLEVVVDTNLTLNEPTSWYWNIRVGDKLQINDAGLWYTVVGPMVVTPQQGNSELFVNVGPPGSPSPLGVLQSGVPVQPEFLFLVNGIDDNKNGWVDEGYDGVDNNFSAEQANGGPLSDRRSPGMGIRGLAPGGQVPGLFQPACTRSSDARLRSRIRVRSRCRRTW